MNLIDVPIINSMIDDDLYKFTQQQAFIQLFPYAHGKYVFKNRGEHRFCKVSKSGARSTDFIDTLNFQLKECLPSLRITEEEIHWMSNVVPFLKPWYLSYLKDFRYNPNDISASLDENGNLSIEANGEISKNMMWEVKTMAIISEIYFRIMDKDWTMGGRRERALTKAKRLSENDCVFVDFGTRRRRSLETQDIVVETMKRYTPPNGHFMGTSNVHLARKHGLIPKGTQAHEWFQAMQALEGVRNSNYYALNNWVRVYNGDLGIALPDTLGVKQFLKNFSLKYAKMFDGVRWDSGDAYWFTDIMINFYKKMGIDPLHKTIIYSNALDTDRAIAIRKYCENKIKASFGIGTFFTNDFNKKTVPSEKSKPLNMVIKLWSVNDIPVVKLSDDEGKVMGDPDAVKITQWVVNDKQPLQTDKWRKKMKKTKVGVVGYSNDDVFDHKIAKALLAIALDVVEKDCPADDYELVSGLTNMGVPKLAYEMADAMGWETVGLSAEEAKEYDCYDVDKEIIEGKKFGDESDKFIDYIDCVIRIGGGKQSLQEIDKAKKKNVPVYEYDLPEKNN